MRIRRYPPKTILSHQGEVADLLWLLTDGIVQLQSVSADGQATIVSAFGPGQLIGGYLENGESQFDIRAIGDVRALEIGAVELRRLLADCPDLSIGLADIYAGQLHYVLDRLALRVSLSAVGRVYRELLRIAGPENTISPLPVVAALALSAQTTRETGSRAISDLERRGIVSRDATKLTILSRRLLEELVV